MFASRWPRSMASKRRKFSASRRNSCTVAIPLMFSCRKALMRAIQVRTVRYDSRTFRRNHCVMRTMSGSTEKATSASRQFIVSEHDHDAGEREHVAEHRDDARGEQVVEDVHVRRDAGHQPADRVAVVELDVQALQVPVDLHAHVVHDPLPESLQDVGLQVLEDERANEDGEEAQRDQVEAGEIAGWRCSGRSPPSSGRAAPAAASTRR